MATSFEEAGLTIVLAGDSHSTAEVALLLENMQMLVSAAVWAAVTNAESNDESVNAARGALLRALEDDTARARFYPGFSDSLRQPGVLPFEANAVDRGQEQDRTGHEPSFDASSPLDVATMVGVNSWMQREVLRTSPELHRRLFSFASISRAQHNSPLLLEFVIVLGAMVAVPVVLTYGLMRATARAKRLNAEAEIRELDVEEKKLAIKQRRVQLIIQEEIADALKAQRKRDPNYQVPESVIANAVQFATPAVSELGSSPLIEKVSFSASLGGKS
jgi:hypothetical protein